jgi:hypothetical protein
VGRTVTRLGPWYLSEVASTPKMIHRLRTMHCCLVLVVQYDWGFWPRAILNSVPRAEAQFFRPCRALSSIPSVREPANRPRILAADHAGWGAKGCIMHLQGYHATLSICLSASRVNCLLFYHELSIGSVKSDLFDHFKKKIGKSEHITQSTDKSYQ